MRTISCLFVVRKGEIAVIFGARALDVVSPPALSGSGSLPPVDPPFDAFFVLLLEGMEVGEHAGVGLVGTFGDIEIEVVVASLRDRD